jgi:hypothetical protein
MTIYRQMPDGTQRQAIKKAGKFVLNDPAHGPKKHHPQNEKHVATENEAEALIRKGFSIRIESPTYASGSVIRNNLWRDGVKLT